MKTIQPINLARVAAVLRDRRDILQGQCSRPLAVDVAALAAFRSPIDALSDAVVLERLRQANVGIRAATTPEAAEACLRAAVEDLYREAMHAGASDSVGRVTA